MKINFDKEDKTIDLVLRVTNIGQVADFNIHIHQYQPSHPNYSHIYWFKWTKNFYILNQYESHATTRSHQLGGIHMFCTSQISHKPTFVRIWLLVQPYFEDIALVKLISGIFLEIRLFTRGHPNKVLETFFTILKVMFWSKICYLSMQLSVYHLLVL